MIAATWGRGGGEGERGRAVSEGGRAVSGGGRAVSGVGRAVSEGEGTKGLLLVIVVDNDIHDDGAEDDIQRMNTTKSIYIMFNTRLYVCILCYV